MDLDHAFLQDLALSHLERLCVELPHRRVGSRWNRAATDTFAAAVDSLGYHVDLQWFECFDWEFGEAAISVADTRFKSSVSPYSLGCDLIAPLVVVSSTDELKAARIEGQILLLRGEIAGEQLIPKKFPFFNLELHQEIIHLLESKHPQAIVAATGHNPGLAGGIVPFPLIEDGDFDIPSVYMTEEEGRRLAANAGRSLSLQIDSRRIPARGCNVSARLPGSSEDRILVCAHIDTKEGTPGALDNGTGVVTLVLLAYLAQEFKGELGLEILALNGEDHYSAAGEIEFLSREEGQLSRITLAINLDSPGYLLGDTAFSLYGCSDRVMEFIRQIFHRNPGLIEGDPWFQSDHSIFIQQNRPAMAITSDQFDMLSRSITHTPEDRIDLVDVSKLVNLAHALHELLLNYP